MNLLGRADAGVSIILLLLLFEFCDTGCGRANGFGGPEAPALSSAEADGEGGGSTTEELCSWPWPFLRCAAFVEERGEEFESAVLLPPSDGSSGICTFNTGLFPPPPLNCAEFVRDGGVNPSGMEDMEILRFLLCVFERCGGEGGLTWVPVLETAPTSTDCDRLFEVAVSPLKFSALEVEDAQCCERIERLSSIGVNMLLDFTDILFTGSSSC
jgi:hypothetical protein